MMNQPGNKMEICTAAWIHACLRWGFGSIIVLAFVAVLAGNSQGPPRDIINRPPPMPTDPVSHGDYDPVMADRQRAALNAERQKEMISDTNKLLKLARELNYEVAASGTDDLTPDDLHRLAEIEKLARSVKEKMAIAGQAVPPSLTPPATFPSN